MAQSSIHIEKGHAGFLTHNDRSRPTKNTIFFDEKNEIFNDSKTAFEIYRKELNKRSEAYTQKTKQKLQKNAITHLSAIVNLNANHSLEDLKPLISHLENELDTKVFQVAIHRDEGHIKTDTKEPIKNYHAHIEFMGLDSQGSSVRRKLTKKFLSDLQTKTAELLQMERGINYAKERKPRPKRLDTYDHKRAKELAEQELVPVLAKQKDLKAEITRLREELKEQGAVREDYAQLEQLNRELKEQIKAKDLTIEELKEKLQAHSIGTSSDDDKLKKLADLAAEKIRAEQEAHKETQKQLSEAQKTILKHEATISLQKQRIELLEQNINDLEHKVRELESELKGYRGKDRQEKRRELATAKKSLKSTESELSSLISTERSEIDIREVEQFITDSTGTDRRKAREYLRLREEFEKFKDRPDWQEAEEINIKELEQELFEAEQELLKAGFEPAQKNEVFEFKYESENNVQNDEILNNTL